MGPFRLTVARGRLSPLDCPASRLCCNIAAGLTQTLLPNDHGDFDWSLPWHFFSCLGKVDCHITSFLVEEAQHVHPDAASENNIHPNNVQQLLALLKPLAYFIAWFETTKQRPAQRYQR